MTYRHRLARLEQRVGRMGDRPALDMDRVRRGVLAIGDDDETEQLAEQVAQAAIDARDGLDRPDLPELCRRFGLRLNGRLAAAG